jgi:Glycosyltransferase family 10 (fucosyltransferase) C-term
MFKVNIVSRESPELYYREWVNKLSKVNLEVLISREPVPADICIVHGVTDTLRMLVDSKNSYFLLSEPPEIYRYKNQFLSQFGNIVGPKFDYEFSGDWEVTNTFLLMFAGVKFQKSRYYNPLGKLGTRFPKLTYRRTFEPTVGNTAEQLFNAPNIGANLLSSVVSDKALTLLQEKRKKFISFLEDNSDIPLNIRGGRYGFISDKWDLLIRSKFHLAIENSIWPDYWTEKLADPILAGNHVFYVGATNIGDYFSSDSVTILDLDNFEAARDAIIRVMKSKSLNASGMLEDKRLLVENYNLRSWINSKFISGEFYNSSMKVNHPWISKANSEY